MIIKGRHDWPARQWRTQMLSNSNAATRVHYRPIVWFFGKAAAATSVTFVSKSGAEQCFGKNLLV